MVLRTYSWVYVCGCTYVYVTVKVIVGLYNNQDASKGISKIMNESHYNII
jgi:hypothetical protein